MTTDRDVLAERVARGAEWLDKVRPEWWTEIDVGTLDLHDGCRCVLGQIVGNSRWWPGGREMSGYSAVLEATSLVFTLAHGFTTHGSDWAVLDDLWIAQIKDRYEHGLPS